MAKKSPPRRARTNDPEGMRRRLINATASLFQARGYHSTTTQDIIREAGVTAGALHHHFPTKKALGLAVIKECVSQAVDETWVGPVLEAPNTVQGILDVFEQIADGLDQRGKVQGCPLNNLALELALSDLDFQRAIHIVFENWRTSIAKKFEADRAAGLLRKGNSEEMAAFVVASYSGAMALAKASQSSEPLRTCTLQLADYFAERTASPQSRVNSSRRSRWRRLRQRHR
jgi:AcrR family transcriptional regulator